MWLLTLGGPEWPSSARQHVGPCGRRWSARRRTARRALASGQAHQRRARRAVLRRTLHRLPRGPTRWRAEDGHSGSPSVSSHIFVDESKERGYLLVAAVILSGDLSDTVQDSAKPGSPTVRMAAGLTS